MRLEAFSRVGGQLCGSWVGVPNWVQKGVGRLSSEYLDESGPVWRKLGQEEKTGWRWGDGHESAE